MNLDMPVRYALGYLIQVLPCGLLLLFCFKDSLRLPFSKAACVAVGAPALCSVLFAVAARRVGYGYAAVQVIFYAGTLVYMALFLLLAKGAFIRLAFAYVMVFCYAVHVSTLELAVSHILPLEGDGIYYWHDILLFAVITGLTLPLFFRLIRQMLSLLPVRANSRLLAAGCSILGCYTLAVSVCVVAAVHILERALFLLVALTSLAGSLAMCCFLYLLLKRLSEQEAIIQRALTAENLVELQKTQYQHMAEYMEQTRKIRHDFRHHIAVINSLASDGNLAGVKKYLSEYTCSVPMESEAPLCRNYIVDMIARYYLSMARKEGVECAVRLALPPQLPIADMDLCIVLGNCLENAVEACKNVPAGKRYIHLSGKVEGEALAIALDNSFDGAPDGAFRSAKPKGGVGLQNVRAVAEKYGGQAIFRGQGNVFESSIVLFFPPDPDVLDKE